jgi:hypothetical protein
MGSQKVAGVMPHLLFVDDQQYKSLRVLVCSKDIQVLAFERRPQ